MSVFEKLGGEITVNTTYARTQDQTEVTVLADGRFVVTWRDYDPLVTNTRYVRAQMFEADGTPVGGEMTIAGPINGAFRPAIDGLAGGGFVVVWKGGVTLQARLYDGDGAPLGTAFTIPTGTSAQEFVVTGLADGGFAISWCDFRSTGGDVSSMSVHVQTYDASGVATSGDVLVNTSTVDSQSFSSVEALAGGGFVVTWYDNTSDPSNSHIRAQIFDAAGARVGTEFNVSAEPGVYGLQAPVTALANGNFAVAWVESAPAFAKNILIQIFTPTGERVGAPIVTPYKLGSMGTWQPDLAALADGSLALVWSADTAPTSDGSEIGVFVQVYGTDGALVGGTMQVNTQANGNQFEPTISALPDGGFVVSWTDTNGPGADDDQVKAQVFGPVGQTEPVAITSNGAGETAAVSIGENGLAVATVAATGGEGPLGFSIAGGADAALFAIDSATGALTFVAAPDHEAPADANGDNVYEVVVAASDGNLGDTQALTVSVADVLEVGFVQTTYALYETTWEGFGLELDDPAVEATSFAITGGADAGYFTLDPATGYLEFAGGDFEAPGDADGDNVYEVRVTAQFAGGSATDTVRFTVNDFDEAPVFLTGTAWTMAEDQEVAAILQAADPEGTAVTYHLTGGADRALFEIDAFTGELFLWADFDYPTDADGDNVYEIEIAASDGENATFQSLRVSVSDVDDALFAQTAFGVDEHASGSALLTPTMADDWFFWIAGGADSSLFTLDMSTGQLDFVGGNFEAPADADGDNVYEIVVSAASMSGEITSLVTFTVADVQEAPVFLTGEAFALTENGAYVGTVQAADPELAALAYTVAGGDDAQLFAIDATTGALSFLAPPDFDAPADADGDNVYLVTVRASDGSVSETQALAITVANVEEAPVIHTTTDSLDENSIYVGTILANDSDGDALTYSIVGGADGGLFWTATWGGLYFNVSPDFEAPGDADGDNVYQVTVGVSDGTATTTAAIAVTVGGVDEAPRFVSFGNVSDPEITLSEGTAAVTTVFAIDPEGDAVSYALFGDDAALFTLDAVTGALSFVAAPDFEHPADYGLDNVYDLEIVASDGTLSEAVTLSVVITNLNEPFTITSPLPEWIDENTVNVTTMTVFDPDYDPITYTITGGADAAQFAIDGNGGLTFVSMRDFEAPADADGDNVYELVVTVSDGTLSEAQVMSIAVADVNERPVVTSNGGGASAALGLAENTTAVTTVMASDPEGGVTYALAGGADAARFTVNAGTGALSFIAAPDFDAPADADGNNVYEVLVSASDGSLIDTQALSIAVGNLSDGLTLTGNNQGNALNGSYEEDSLSGLGGNDTLRGFGAADVLNGGEGQDRLIGGAGADMLTGGLKADIFEFEALSDSTIAASDRILDFNRSQGDKIELVDLDANSVLAGNQAFSFIGTAAFSNVAGQLRYFQQNGDTFVSGDVDGDGAADFQIVLDPLVSLISSDFLL